MKAYRLRWIWLVMLMSAGSVAAQQPPRETPGPLVLSAGFGVGSPELNHTFGKGIGFCVALTVNNGSHDVFLRYTEVGQTRGFSRVSVDLALLHGLRFPQTWGWTRAAIGPALAGQRLGTSTVGLATQFDLTWESSARHGFGVAIIGNLNLDGLFAGAMLTVHLGATR